YIWARRAAINYWKVIDAAGAATMIGLAIGRIGDVINGEHHGTPTNLPWGVEYVNPNTLGQPGLVVHPEVAYEMILTLVLLGVLLPFHQRLKARLPAGVLGLIYLGLYGLGRFFLSYLRTDPAVFAGLRQAQLASLLMFVIAVVAIPFLMRRQTTTMRREMVNEPAVVEAIPHEVEEDDVAEPEPAPIAETAPEPVAAPSAAPEPATPTPRPPRTPRVPGAPRRRRTNAPPTPAEPIEPIEPTEPAEPTDDLPG
ncbi:MAG: phosphatidylglycerol---prolipoprotein diacylglyceryl transferase, partial [Chloroflexota bacterium]|nr:phosphatidylglycerol---prolipoprotein diacylglyceryl transferase [Chloroflexota bacterium]